MEYWRMENPSRPPFAKGRRHPSFQDSAEQFLLLPSHLPGSFSCSFMLITDQVKEAMDHEKEDRFHVIKAKSGRLAPGCIHGDNEVAEKLGVEDRKFSFLHWKGNDVGRAVPMKILPVQLSNPGIIDEQDGEFGLRELQAGQHLSDRSSNFF